MPDDAENMQIAMNAADLYIEESFTDRRVGALQRLTPVTSSGQPDATRQVLFLGQTQVLTPAGALPLSFEIEAASLEQAVAGFGAAAEAALQSTMQRLEEMRREQASSLIVPGSSGTGRRGGGFQVP